MWDINFGTNTIQLLSSMCLSVCLSVSAFLSLCLIAHQTIPSFIFSYSSLCSSLVPFICSLFHYSFLFQSWSDSPSVNVSICPFIHMSIHHSSTCLCVCLYIYLLVHFSIHAASLFCTAVTVNFSSTTYSVFEGDGVANISLELTGAAQREITIFIQTSNGMATGSPGK